MDAHACGAEKSVRIASASSLDDRMFDVAASGARTSRSAIAKSAGHAAAVTFRSALCDYVKG